MGSLRRAGQRGGPLAQRPALPSACVLGPRPGSIRGPRPRHRLCEPVSELWALQPEEQRVAPSRLVSPAYPSADTRTVLSCCCPWASGWGCSPTLLREMCAAEACRVSSVRLRAALLQRQLSQPLQMPCTGREGVRPSSWAAAFQVAFYELGLKHESVRSYQAPAQSSGLARVNTSGLPAPSCSPGQACSLLPGRLLSLVWSWGPGESP